MSRGVWIIGTAASLLLGLLSGMTALVAELSWWVVIAVSLGATALAAAIQIAFPQAPTE